MDKAQHAGDSEQTNLGYKEGRLLMGTIQAHGHDTPERLARLLRLEAVLADRPGQLDRLENIADRIEALGGDI